MELLENSRAKSFIKTPKLNVILCVFANDGTALETGHWVDSRLKENIDLKTPVDIQHV